MSSATHSAARVRPPSQNNRTELAVVAATASAVTATGVGDASDFWLTVACPATFNINFSDDGTNDVDDPSNSECFVAGVHSFELNSRNTHFKITSSANGTVLYWHSSRS